VIATFRQTIASLKDKDYGSKIIVQPLTKIVWYYTRYLLLFTLIPLVVVIFLITYFLPQLPKIITKNFPSAQINLKNGQFSTTLPNGTLWADKDLSLIINTSGSAELLQSAPAGVLITSNSLIIKTADSKIEARSLSEFSDFNYEKAQILNWVATHQTLLFCISIGLCLVVFILIFMITWLARFVTFLVWALLLWLLTKTLHQPLNYTSALKLVIFASVIPLIISSVFFFYPSIIITIFSYSLFVYFTVIWTRRLTPLKKS